MESGVEVGRGEGVLIRCILPHMESNFELGDKYNVLLKENTVKGAFGDSNMAALHYQNLMVGTNNNAEHAMEDEPDPREVKIYVDNIISGAIVRVQEENPRAFKNKISPTSCGAERDMMKQRHGKETGNKQVG
uniref:Uncharacterized protein LOC111129687 n=1 Tax=Crassostrea virginica TaxID=6565 RepID=A0A8B8DUE8_CRAVI|nr:uncharacterized protein LOC111129687 [Crassostrea virginica]